MSEVQSNGDKSIAESEPSNSSMQGVDKTPEHELGNEEGVTAYDLKAKKVDADPEEEEKKPDAIRK